MLEHCLFRVLSPSFTRFKLSGNVLETASFVRFSLKNRVFQSISPFRVLATRTSFFSFPQKRYHSFLLSLYKFPIFLYMIAEKNPKNNVNIEISFTIETIKVYKKHCNSKIRFFKIVVNR